MVQEGSRRGVNLDDFARADHIEPIERAHRAVGLALRGAERRKVVAADKALRGRMHLLGVETAGDVPDVIARECRRCATVENTVDVVARDSREARLEIPVDLLC